MSSTWFDERRADRAAEAEERRKDIEFEDDRRRAEARRDREEQRQDKAQRRREKAQRKQARAARRERQFTPVNVYRKGTLLLVAMSALASLPAQILHFMAIHWMLFPVGPALEGSAWVMFAGVAYADERKLSPWVRWLLRALSLAAASFAAYINFQYGLSLQGDGVSAQDARAAGLGLAAVTLGGPMFFEVRQWVITLTASTASPKQQAEDKARGKHERGRRRKFKAVTRRQQQLILASPYGSLSKEKAWARAWADVEGTGPGDTARSIAYRLFAQKRVERAIQAAGRTPESVAVDRLLEELFPPDGDDGNEPGGTPGGGPGNGPRPGAPKTRTTLGGKGKRRVRSKADKEPQKPLGEADLTTVRQLAAALGPERLSARNVREAVGCRNEYAVRLRDAVQKEMGETT